MSLRRFISRAFGRRGLPRGDGRASEDWRPGDLGECILANEWHCLATGRPSPGPKHRELVRVADVGMVNGIHVLAIVGWPGSWFTAVSFRKFYPEQDEASDHTFAEQIRKCRPKAPSRERADA